MINKLFFLLLIGAALHFLFQLYLSFPEYTKPFDAKYWEMRYEQSQWNPAAAKRCANLDLHVNPYTCTWDDQWYAKHKNSPESEKLKKVPMGDDELYTYAGWKYVQGHDPTLLNAEIPPYGKYLIGLSIMIFQNHNIFALLTGIFALIGFYVMNTQVFQNKKVAIIPVALFSLEPLFYKQLSMPLLDLLYLGLLFFTLYFFLKKLYIPSAIFLGLMAATKASIATFGLVIFVCLFTLLLQKQWKQLRHYLFSLVFAVGTFMLTYLQFFLLGNTVKDLLGVQKWIVNFYASGAKGSLSAPWEMVATGKFQNWMNNQYTIVSEWHFGWFLLAIGSIIIFGYIVQNQSKARVLLIGLWFIVYMLFLSFIPLWPRYFLLVLPFMYNLSIWFIVTRYKIHENKK